MLGIAKIFCNLFTSIFCILFPCKVFTPLLGSSHLCRQPWRNSGKVALKPVQPHSRSSSAKLSHNYGAEPVRTNDSFKQLLNNVIIYLEKIKIISRLRVGWEGYALARLYVFQPKSSTTSRQSPERKIKYWSTTPQLHAGEPSVVGKCSQFKLSRLNVFHPK